MIYELDFAYRSSLFVMDVASFDGSDRPNPARDRLGCSQVSKTLAVSDEPFCYGVVAFDAVVSPQHRILLRDCRAELMFGEQEVLAPVKALINGASIRQKTAETIDYYHLLFDRHEIVFANGVPTESFYPGDYMLDEMSAATYAELLTLFPELRGGAAAYGKMARRCLKPWEATALASSA